MPGVVAYACAAMLFVGAMPMPYGYYTLLRIVVFFVFAYLSYLMHKEGKEIWPWVLGLVAIVFNPVLKIYLPKDVWSALDVAAGILLLSTFRVIKKQ